MHAAISSESLFHPLLHPRFRQLWLANLVSNIGGWAQAFAAAWQVSALSQSTQVTSLVQVATWAPMLLFALPAGVLGDFVHKPKLLFRCNALMGWTAAAMALLTLAGKPSAASILLLTFLMGVGVALKQPVWQASMPELVAKESLASVVSLNNISNNMAALIGPCLGAPLLQTYGPASLYILNAVSFCGLIWFYRQWLTQEKPSTPIRRFQANALVIGIAASWRSLHYRKLMLYSLVIFCGSVALPSLLPSLVRDVQANAGDFGLLMGALGGGAVIASAVLPRLQRRIGQRSLLASALALHGVAMALVGVIGPLGSRVLLVLVAGMAWSASVTTFNRAAIAAFPAELRARTLSAYIFMFAAGQTLGGFLWGALASRLGIVPALLCAAGTLLACAASLSITTDFLEKQ